MAKKSKHDTPQTKKQQPNKPSRLGRGLSSLMGHTAQASPPSGLPGASPGALKTPVKVDVPRGTSLPDEAVEAKEGGLVEVAVESLAPSPHQPRTTFHKETIKGLSESILREGMMQPIIVRPVPAWARPGQEHTATEEQRKHHNQNNKSVNDITYSEEILYEIIAGERRWQAAKMAGLSVVPAVVRELDDRQMAEWGLIENLQREDLNPMDRAWAFNHLIERFGLSHEQVADRVGIDRTTVSNLLRLLPLDPMVRQMIADGAISVGQGKVLARLQDGQAQYDLAVESRKKDWSVRQLDSAVKAWIRRNQGMPEPPAKPIGKKGHIKALEEMIGEQLQTRVRVKQSRKKGSGTLQIDYYSLDHFDSLLQRLKVKVE